MTRLPDWHPRLAIYVSSIARKPFRPGRLDCCLFAAGAVEAMTGDDIAKDWRGYKTIENGLKSMKQAGFADHVAFVATLFDEAIHAHAAPGDIAVVDNDALGIVQGQMIYVMGLTGLGFVPMAQAIRIFKV